MSEAYSPSMLLEPCPRKYAYRYLAGVDNPRKPEAYDLGSLTHAYIEEMHIGGGLPGFSPWESSVDEIRRTRPREADELIAQAVHFGKRYCSTFKDDIHKYRVFATEQRFTFACKDALVAPKPDAVFEVLSPHTLYDSISGESAEVLAGDLIIVELKTTSDSNRDEYMSTLRRDLQTGVGALAVEISTGKKVGAIFYRAIRKIICAWDKLLTPGGKLSTDKRLVFDEKTLELACHHVKCEVPSDMRRRAQETELVFSSIRLWNQVGRFETTREVDALVSMRQHEASLGFPPRRDPYVCRKCPVAGPCQLDLSHDELAAEKARWNLIESKYTKEFRQEIGL